MSAYLGLRSRAFSLVAVFAALLLSMSFASTATAAGGNDKGADETLTSGLEAFAKPGNGRGGDNGNGGGGTDTDAGSGSDGGKGKGGGKKGGSDEEPVEEPKQPWICHWGGEGFELIRPDGSSHTGSGHDNHGFDRIIAPGGTCDYVPDPITNECPDGYEVGAENVCVPIDDDPDGPEDCQPGERWNGANCVPGEDGPEDCDSAEEWSDATDGCEPLPNGPEDCEPGEAWNGTSCVIGEDGPEDCDAGQEWNGTACVTGTDGPEDCEPGEAWNGTSCVIGEDGPEDCETTEQWNDRTDKCEPKTTEGDGDGQGPGGGDSGEGPGGDGGSTPGDGGNKPGDGDDDGKPGDGNGGKPGNGGDNGGNGPVPIIKPGDGKPPVDKTPIVKGVEKPATGNPGTGNPVLQPQTGSNPNAGVPHAVDAGLGGKKNGPAKVLPNTGLEDHLGLLTAGGLTLLLMGGVLVAPRRRGVHVAR